MPRRSQPPHRNYCFRFGPIEISIKIKNRAPVRWHVRAWRSIFGFRRKPRRGLYPAYVMVGARTMMYRDGINPETGNVRYWRAAGCWGVDAVFGWGNNMFSLFQGDPDDSLSGLPIVPVTLEEHANDNRGYWSWRDDMPEDALTIEQIKLQEHEEQRKLDAEVAF
jgi:hypothetical protein